MINPLTLIFHAPHKFSSIHSNHDTKDTFEGDSPYQFNKPIELEKVKSEKKKLEIRKRIEMIKHRDLRARLYLSAEELNSL